MKTIKQIRWLIPILVLLTACNLGRAINPDVPTTPTTPNMVQTAAAATVAAIHTEQASENIDNPVEIIPTDTTQPGQPTNTPPASQPSNTPESQPTATEEPVAPTSTPWPTYTALPTYTPYPTNTPTPAAPCNQMKFIRDVTIPDETWMRPGQAFTKIWEIQNTGSCAWDSTYSIVWGDSGNQMGAASTKALPKVPVNPGDKIQVAIAFTAPNTVNIYTGVWKLQPASSDKFGTMTVKVNVAGNVDTIYFADMLCSAEWRSSSGILPCPNEKTNPKGVMYIDETPSFETGYTDNEKAIILRPEQKENGEIEGRFFYVKMPATSAYFRTILGCTKDKTNCDVDVFLYYRIKGSDTSYLLGGWDERFDNSIQNINIDLAGKSLEGQEVEFTFIVKAQGPYADDEVFFLMPRIELP
ncbi:MAG: NBR1-Ig-like domain-containing protein [Anaerolineae bacterium]|jgi:hypothetical protein|nr:NBR1-Ig-like domain-containing protein [Anaerolineae bacterium]